MFEGVKDRFSLKLTKTRVFGNGNILLNYEPVQEEGASYFAAYPEGCHTFYVGHITTRNNPMHIVLLLLSCHSLRPFQNRANITQK